MAMIDEMMLNAQKKPEIATSHTDTDIVNDIGNARKSQKKKEREKPEKRDTMFQGSTGTWIEREKDVNRRAGQKERRPKDLTI